MLPPEPQRSRASELKSEVRIPPKDEAVQSENAQIVLEALVTARKLRKQHEADQQRLCRQRLKWERACEEALNSENSENCVSDETRGSSFWQRHAFGRLSRRTPPAPPGPPGTVSREKLCREMFRRVPAHTTDAVKAVLAEKKPKAPQSLTEQAQILEDSQTEHWEGSFDWASPYALAYNSVAAGLARQEKWEQRRLAQQEPHAKTEITYGYDDEDVKLLKSSQRLDQEAGGGLSLALRVLALKEQGLKQGMTWQEFVPLAARARATSFEMPKEVALQAAVAFGEVSQVASSEIESARAQSITQAESFDSPEFLRQTAMAMMSSAAARARDSDSCEFPLQGLEAIAQSGLGWRAFSNMFLAALYAQLQREASDQGSRIEMKKDLALRVASVFVWASNRLCDVQNFLHTVHTADVNTLTALRSNLSPAGRRVVKAAHDALLDQEQSVATLELLEKLAIRDTSNIAG